MTTVSKETATLLIQIAFLVGAVTNGLAIIPMLSHRVGAALFGGGSSRNSTELRYAILLRPQLSRDANIRPHKITLSLLPLVPLNSRLSGGRDEF